MTNHDANDAIKEAESFCKPMTEEQLAKALTPNGARLALYVGVSGLHYGIPVLEAADTLELIARYYREGVRA